MKKIFISVLLFLVLVQGVMAFCEGADADEVRVGCQGSIVLTASNNFIEGDDLHWELHGSKPGAPDNIIFQEIPGDSCSINFTSYVNDTFTIRVSDDGGQEEYYTVEVKSVLYDSECGPYGHQCYVVDTSNCGDIFNYGEITARGGLSADEIYAYGSVHSLNNIYVGGFNQVSITRDRVVFPRTTFTGDLKTPILRLSGVIFNPAGAVVVDDDLMVTGSIGGGSDGVLSIADNVDIKGGLDVVGPATFHKLESISSDSGTLNVYADMDVDGTLTVNSISLGGDTRSKWDVNYEELGIENLFENPGFEYTYSDGTLTGWTGNTLFVENQGVMGNALRVTSTSNNIIQSVKLDSKFEYTVSAVAKGSADTLAASIIVECGPDLYKVDVEGIDNYFNNGITPPRVDFTLTTGYKPYSGSFGFVNKNQGLVTCSFILRGPASGSVYFDNLQLEEGFRSNKFRPRMLDFYGNAEFKDLDVMGVLMADEVSASESHIFGDLFVDDDAKIGSLEVDDSVVISGNVMVDSDKRLMGSVNLKASCAASSPRMYQEGNDFIIDLGKDGQCEAGDPCVSNSDCSSNICAEGVCVL